MPRKNFRPRLLLARISTTVDISEAKGGGTHDTIVRVIGADERRAIVEYAAIVALIAAGCVFGYQLLGGKVAALITSVVTAFS